MSTAINITKFASSTTKFQVQSNVQCHGLSPAMPGMQMPQGAGSRPLLPVEVQCPLLNSRRCLGYTTQHCTLTSKATSIASTNTTSTSAPSTSQWLVSRSLHGEQQERLATPLQGSELPDCCGLVTLHWAAFSETGCQAESPESYWMSTWHCQMSDANATTMQFAWLPFCWRTRSNQI